MAGAIVLATGWRGPVGTRWVREWARTDMTARLPRTRRLAVALTAVALVAVGCSYTSREALPPTPDLRAVVDHLRRTTAP